MSDFDFFGASAQKTPNTSQTTTPQEEDCVGDELESHRFIPVYFFLHKSLDSQITKEATAHDLLDNEHGGLINVKFTPSLFTIGGKDANSSGIKGLLDFGVKYVEATSADPKSKNYVGAGYFGIGTNFEFSMYDPTVTSRDILAGSKPAGAMAVGFGVYRNYVNSGGFDNSAFSSPVPKSYGTVVLGYEFQITNLISIAGTRSIPTAHNSLGTSTSVSVKYNF